MDSAGIFNQQISETIQQLKTRFELERYFSKDYLPAANNLVEEKDLSADSPINSIPEVSLASDSKKTLFNLLEQKINTCVLCDSRKTTTNFVLGEGSLDAKLVFIGEDLLKDADYQMNSSVELPCDLFEKIINAMEINRSDIFITNGFRCLPHLLEFLKIIKPKVICTLGEFATHALLNQATPIAQLRGKIFNFNQIKLVSTYHPAYLIKKPEDKKFVWNDMRKILKILKADET